MLARLGLPGPGRAFGRWGILALWLSMCALAPTASANEVRFGVVDLAPSPRHEALISAIEKDVARLRPESRPIDDPLMRRLLATGEGPASTALRLFEETKSAGAAGDCATAVQKGAQAETAILGALTIDEERDALKTLYGLLVICNHKLAQEGPARTAAARLRALVSLPPGDFPTDLWETYVANATGPEPSVELQVDSDPPNAQVSVNFHGEGVTPRTLKVAPGLVYVELQKEGYKKAFRAVDVKSGRPTRTVLRLVQKTHDRLEQAEAQLRVLWGKGELPQRSLTLSRLAQLARVETLVLVSATEGRVKIWFFDAERGALTGDPINSEYDAQTGRVSALANRPTPAAGKPAAPAAPAAPPPSGTATPPPPPKPEAPAPGGASLPEAKATDQMASYRPRKKKEGAPWWSWAIAGAIGVAFGAFVYLDRPQESKTVGVRARWVPPP